MYNKMILQVEKITGHLYLPLIFPQRITINLDSKFTGVPLNALERIIAMA